ncbi:GNAT family N-acetyltransferase [Streptomyces xiamenensis]|uniref:GNAT family N-acetyltransferase n=1 Tax=Streptomyces xiamenensis TaxID=408015 RepID=UPI003D72A70C
MRNSEIRTLLGLHHTFLLSTFCSERHPMPHGDLMLSDLIADPYYNFFCPDAGFAWSALGSLSDALHDRGRQPALYTTPLSPMGKDAPAGFSPHACDSWMLREASPRDTGITPGIEVRSITTDTREEFLTAFSSAYSSDDAVDLYGPLEESHIQALRRSFEITGPEYEKFYLLARSGGRAVGVAVLLVAGAHAGVYAVGTVADARGRGVGRALLNECSGLAFDTGATSLFLQVEAGTAAEKWYGKLGYRHAFHGTCYASGAPR